LKDLPEFPETQHAVQLVGPDALEWNRAKRVPRPRPHEILMRVEAVGLCFSDLKLLKRFTGHARKGPVLHGMDPEVLAGIQSYVPDRAPTVPGHETVGRIVAIGEEVRHHRVGERCLVQTDYRWLRTDGSNAAFGYNFEGGLQEYTLFDERVVMDPAGRRLLIPVGEEQGASAVALVEPWACVGNAYGCAERTAIRPGGELLVVAEEGAGVPGLEAGFDPAGGPARVTRVAPAALAGLPDEAFDDIVYLGADPRVLAVLGDKLATGGLANLVLGGRRIGALVPVDVGRVHYAGTRWIGTPGEDASAGYRRIPATGELRGGDRFLVLGAGGPMGQMHVLRALSSDVPGLSVTGTDLDAARLAALEAKAAPLARSRSIDLRLVAAARSPWEEGFRYVAILVPAPALVAEAVAHAADGAIINVFAGIPAGTLQPLDLDTYVARGAYLLGTSGSLIEDMRIVLDKLESGRLDTDASIDAVTGMAGAIEGIRAVEERRLPGKVVVYPCLHDLDFVPLSELPDRFPTVAARLADGRWSPEAERELLRVAGA